MNRKAIFILMILIISSLTTLILISSSLCDTQITTDLADDVAPAIIQASDDKLWIVWHSYRTGNADLFYKIYIGSSWSSDTQLTNNASVDALPSIMQTNDGTLWVFWTTSRTGNYDIFYKTSSDGGSLWSDASNLTDDSNDDRSSSILEAIDGKIWVVWQSYRTGNYDIFYKTSSDGGSLWSDAIPFITNPNNDRYPFMLQSSDGTLWVFWASNRTGNEHLFYKTSADNGTSWSSETQLTTGSSSVSFPSAMQAIDGKIWVVWQSRNLQDDIFYKVYDGSSWSSDNYLTWFMEYDRAPSILQAANETIWLVWASDKSDNFDVYYKFVIIDMSIVDVTVSKTVVPKNDQVDIYVLVRNEGTASVTFNVTTYCNGIPIGTYTNETMIPSMLGRQFTFTLNTTDMAYGYYPILVTVDTALNENDPTDNSFPYGVITVTIPGDITGDGTVNILDAGSISSHWYPGPPAGPLGYDANADINNDGKVDITDAAIVNVNWQKSW